MDARQAGDAAIEILELAPAGLEEAEQDDFAPCALARPTRWSSTVITGLRFTH